MKRLFLVFIILFVSCISADEWVIESVDSGDDPTSNTSTSLMLDSSGNPHISYCLMDFYPDKLKYAYWNGSDWITETVDTEGYNGEGSSLVLDSSDNPHISYHESDPNYDLKYASWNGSTWEIETVDTHSEAGRYSSLALDQMEYPHISYLCGGSLRYASWDGSSWNIETVDSTDMVGFYTSLKLDSNGYPHISYYDATNQDLKYAKWNGSSWDIVTVDTGLVIGYTSLDLNTNDNAHISYTCNEPFNLKYAKYNDTNWVIETVDSEEWVGKYTSIQLDNYGNPHISYFDANNDDLKYAVWNGSNWEISKVNTDGTLGHDSCLVLDDNNNPLISSYGSYSLKYAWWNYTPLAFSLLSPLDGDIVEDYPLCDWEDSVDPDGNDITYNIWYSTEFDFEPYGAVYGLTESQYQFTGDKLDPNTTYYWKVKAYDGYGGTWSNETWSFTTSNIGVDGAQLTASSEDDGVLNSWTITGDTPSSIRVLRGEEEPVAVSGSLDGSTVRWLDRDVEPGESYVYWLEVTDSDGHVKRFGPTEAVVVPEQAQRLALEEPWPNPADNSVSVAFSLPEAQNVSLSVYDLAGRRVTTLSEGELPAGRHAVSWDCAGEASGVYLLRLETAGEALSRRVVVGR
jgi:hypothetical protein